MRAQSSPWPVVALLVGVVLGLALGLAISWGLWPVQIINADPMDLRAPLREDYLILIGQAYSVEGDLVRARKRLATLGPWGEMQTITGLVKRYLDEGGDPRTVAGLMALADALLESPTVTPSLTLAPTLIVQASPTPSPTATSTATPSPRLTPAATPTPTPRPPVRLLQSERLCSAAERAGHILVYVQDEQGVGLPNVEIRISWATGEDRFFTGLKPEVDPGYADFAMERGVVYQVRVGRVDSEVAGDISATPCDGEDEAAAWRVIFQWTE